MRKFSFLFLALVSLSVFSSAQVSYSIETGHEKAEINTTIQLSCEESSRCPVNQWSIPSWPLPENAEVKSIRDSKGKIEEYSVEDNTLSFETNTGDRRRSETVQINMVVRENSESIYRGLEQRKFSIPGVSGKKTSGTIKVDDLISGRSGFGFDSAYSNDSMNFTGTGPTNVRIKFGQGNETKYFEFFGTDDVENSKLAYEVSVGMTGQVQDFERFPVAVMNSKTFDTSVGEWSAGEYIGGSIKLRNSLEPDDKAAVLAHEVVHGLNDRELKWDQTRSSYIDEGTGKYVEFLIRKKLQEEKEIANIFGEDKTYIENRDGKRYRVTIPSRGDREQLWDYYENDRELMKDWSPSKYPEWRSFGYAYSDLIIRNYIVNTNGSMKDIYEIRPGKEVESNEEKWSIYSQKLDLTPCDYNDRERFENCIDRINNHEYSLTRATNIDRVNKVLNVEQVKFREDEKADADVSAEAAENSSNSSNVKTDGGRVSLLERIYRVFTSFVRNI